jgi:phage regulator Rha-like protein
MSKNLIPANLETRIYTIRGQKVMLDSDLAWLYGVETKALNQAVKRNSERFPDSFMLELTPEEEKVLKSQIVTSKNSSEENKEKRGGRRYPAKVFTEHGVLMLANVLRSKRAIAVSIQIVEAFVKLRAVAAIHGEFSIRLSELEKTVKSQGGSIDFILDLIDKELKKKKIGFKPK